MALADTLSDVCDASLCILLPLALSNGFGCHLPQRIPLETDLSILIPLRLVSCEELEKEACSSQHWPRGAPSPICTRWTLTRVDPCQAESIWTRRWTHQQQYLSLYLPPTSPCRPILDLSHQGSGKSCLNPSPACRTLANARLPRVSYAAPARY